MYLNAIWWTNLRPWDSHDGSLRPRLFSFFDRIVWDKILDKFFFANIAPLNQNWNYANIMKKLKIQKTFQIN